jgi:DNA-binding MarR family transcriptional regulator
VILGEKLKTNRKLCGPSHEIGDERDASRLQPVCRDPAEWQQQQAGDKRAPEDEREGAGRTRRTDDRQGKCGGDDPIAERVDHTPCEEDPEVAQAQWAGGERRREVAKVGHGRKLVRYQKICQRIINQLSICVILVAVEPHDSVDEHVAHWLTEIPDLDPVTEGVVTRMQVLVKHLRRTKQAALSKHNLQDFEYDTLHTLVGRGVPYQAHPSELATAMRMSPAAVTGRLDALERRGYIRRLPPPGDRRKVIVELTAAGHAAWREAMADQGDEEDRIIAALSRSEQEQLADLLRRMVLVVEPMPRTSAPAL